MNLISAVEYFSNRILVRVTSQFKIEATIMNENFNYFKLTYLSSFLESPIIKKLGISGELPAAYGLLYLGTSLGQEKLD